MVYFLTLSTVFQMIFFKREQKDPEKILLNINTKATSWIDILPAFDFIVNLSRIDSQLQMNEIFNHQPPSLHSLFCTAILIVLPVWYYHVLIYSNMGFYSIILCRLRAIMFIATILNVIWIVYICSARVLLFNFTLPYYILRTMSSFVSTNLKSNEIKWSFMILWQNFEHLWLPIAYYTHHTREHIPRIDRINK